MDFETQILVCPSDTDSYNIIHHPQYFVWVEQAILEWLDATYQGINNVSYEILKFQCKFLSPGLLYERLTLSLRCKGKKTADGVLKFQVKIIKQANKQPVLDGDFFVKVREVYEAG